MQLNKLAPVLSELTFELHTNLQHSVTRILSKMLLLLRKLIECGNAKIHFNAKIDKNISDIFNLTFCIAI